MSAVKIIKEMFHCKCEAKHKDGTTCGYEWEPENIPLRCPSCKSRRWNRRSRYLLVTFNGVSLTRSGWAKKLGLSKTVILWRMKQGWPMEQVLSSEDWRWQK